MCQSSKPSLTNLLAVLTLLSVLFMAPRAVCDERAVTVEDALLMMDAMPAKEMDVNGPPHRWSHQGQANRIAAAISAHAGTSEQGTYLVVYDIFESNNLRTAVGDGGKSHGPWQLGEEHAKREVAEDPDQAAPIWLALADKSRRDCADLPEDDQLAELASGNCGAGRALARRRAKLVRRAIAALRPAQTAQQP